MSKTIVSETGLTRIEEFNDVAPLDFECGGGAEIRTYDGPVPAHDGSEYNGRSLIDVSDMNGEEITLDVEEAFQLLDWLTAALKDVPR